MNPDKKAMLIKDPVMVRRAELVAELLGTIGVPDDKQHPLEQEGLKETPLRVAKMYDELFWGYQVDTKQILKDALFVDEHSHDMVVVKDIAFSSMCEHHIMPFMGTVTIAYIPQDGNIVGLSKLVRLVDAFSKRLQVQERLGAQIAQTMVDVLNPLGVAVIIKAQHTCVECRGVNRPGVETVTSALRGSFFLDDKCRNELMSYM